MDGSSARAAMGAAGKEQCQKLCGFLSSSAKKSEPKFLTPSPQTKVMFLFSLSPLVGSAMAEEAMSCHLLTAHTAACHRHEGGSRQDLLEGLPLHTLGCKLASGCTLEL